MRARRPRPQSMPSCCRPAVAVLLGACSASTAVGSSACPPSTLRPRFSNCCVDGRCIGLACIGGLDLYTARMSTLDPALIQLLQRAESLVARLDAFAALAPTSHCRTRLVGFGGLPLPQRTSAAWAAGWLEPVRHVARIDYAALREVDTQKERFARNLGQLPVAGKTANNVLLSGARGTGKSSLVKAGLQAHTRRACV